ncbi:hypothetical protein FO501_28815 [Bacillus pacificus]|nr:hypothetical protein [Bacillus pacificus]
MSGLQLNAWPTKRIVWFLWFVLVPLLVPLYGYFPGKRIGIMCDLPKGVIKQWRHWCLHRHYAPQAEGEWLWQRFAQVKQPITALAFSDDEMMSKAGIDALHGFFSGSEVTRIEISPAQIGKKRIGHIGWHRRGYEALWQHYLLPLLPAAGDLHVTPAAQA